MPDANVNDDLPVPTGGKRYVYPEDLSPEQARALSAPFGKDELQELDDWIASLGPHEVARRLCMRTDRLTAISSRLNVRDGTRIQFRIHRGIARREGTL